MKLSIIIPAYNEEKRIKKTLKNYYNFFRKKKIEFEIIIVLNACRDNTLGVVKTFQKGKKEIKYLNFKLGGKGFAVKEGFKDALKRENDLVGFVDADMSTPPKAFYDLVKNLDNFDGIIADRWLANSKINFHQSLLRKLTSRTFNFVVRSFLMLPYRDTQCGAKLFKKQVIKKILPKLNNTQWAFDVDLIYLTHKYGFKLKEISTTWNDEKGSKIDVIRSSLKMFLAVLRLRLINSPFKFVVEAYNKLPESLKINHRILN
jgi:glycosyltransferase involved in cell wall biosynthesis